MRNTDTLTTLLREGASMRQAVEAALAADLPRELVTAGSAEDMVAEREYDRARAAIDTLSPSLDDATIFFAGRKARESYIGGLRNELAFDSVYGHDVPSFHVMDPGDEDIIAARQREADAEYDAKWKAVFAYEALERAVADDKPKVIAKHLEKIRLPLRSLTHSLETAHTLLGKVKV